VIPRPSRLPAQRRPAARSGFSLIESLAVVTIIGIMAAAVMPSITEMIASTRQHAAANDIMLLARRARREAVLGKYAYALVFQQAAGGGNGAIQIVTGVTGHCNRATAVNFGNDPFTGIPLPVGWQAALGAMSIGEFSFSGHRVFGTMQMPEGSARAALTLCYAANGETHVSGGGAAAGEQADPALLLIQRTTGGIQTGIDRQVVFMPGGTARIR
jgi:prepilin-type N-terminal cleavage/methylation domain-containing protein